jgi:hypothetical protein
MSGKELKEKLASENISISELARMLGFANDQRLHSALKSEDVKTGLVEAIARVTNKSVCFFYGTGNNVVASENSVAVRGNENSVSTIPERITTLLEKKDEQISKSQEQISKSQEQLSKSQEQIDRLLTLIERMQK